MSIKVQVDDAPDFAQMVGHLAVYYDGTPDCGQRILDVILGFAHELSNCKSDITDIIGAAERLADGGVLDHRDVREQLVEPFCPEFRKAKPVRQVVCAHS